MTDNEVFRQINRRMDKQDELLAEIREEQVRVAAAAESIAPALDEIIAFWKGSRILARILGTAAALCSLAVGALVWAKDHVK
jgi:hypothetical protein